MIYLNRNNLWQKINQSKRIREVFLFYMSATVLKGFKAKNVGGAYCAAIQEERRQVFDRFEEQQREGEASTAEEKSGSWEAEEGRECVRYVVGNKTPNT